MKEETIRGLILYSFGCIFIFSFLYILSKDIFVALWGVGAFLSMLFLVDRLLKLVDYLAERFGEKDRKIIPKKEKKKWSDKEEVAFQCGILRGQEIKRKKIEKLVDELEDFYPRSHFKWIINKHLERK